MARANALLLRLGVSGALIGLLAWRLDGQALRDAFVAPTPSWLLLALLVSVPQVVLSAWRWRLTARRMGLTLSLRRAVAEYYAATFLNQVLPGGVVGDATRAWRHAQTSLDRARAWRAVVIERLSGQVMLLLIALAGLAAAPSLRNSLIEVLSRLGDTSWAGLAVGAAGLAALALWICRRPPAWLRHTLHDLEVALVASSIWLWQSLGSLGVVASYIAIYAIAARAIGADLALGTLLPLIPPVLMVMAIPLSVAGWGLREGAAALVWMGAGLDPAQGVAISLVYGAIVLVSSLPGAWLLCRRRPPRRDRHAPTPSDPLPSES
ncbi:flippase-like domain-containing protein [Chromohalobacter canadensis]|uniref:lysylphosphatidylglycerol synthase transmembrane domain-containing protein n=1 Tax=Chromohalobacter canadensis TaxID=141389 RepID=UPI0021C11946|nr:lysylphosphatidylglycerol synthase transmembrane domain-containing protein [Chromohalobacter canadensis]MCT8467629.1 flippase-like domain-containing protein [Chromohalobacter canadensis]MCT8470623.1 flippase-like domain-containing protein [Chromohalobacter canadensis]MCT8498126.1 flippase-like domain-containing protein [Chromohalobacter canadensis]